MLLELSVRVAGEHKGRAGYRQKKLHDDSAVQVLAESFLGLTLLLLESLPIWSRVGPA